MIKDWHIERQTSALTPKLAFFNLRCDLRYFLCDSGLVWCDLF